MNCKACNTAITANFCPDCGQPKNLKRIDGHYILHEIEHVLHFERGILYTVKELCLNPGQTIRNYMSENRSRLVKPVFFIIITSLIYTLISHFFHLEEYVKAEGLEKSAIGSIFKWIQANYGYANILTGAFVALWLKVFFKKYGYNFYELLIMLCFTLGISMLIFAFFGIIEGISHVKLLSVAGAVGFLYLVWATGDFFEKNKISNYLKALFAYILGTITLYMIVFGVGITIDIITKH